MGLLLSRERGAIMAGSDCNWQIVAFGVARRIKVDLPFLRIFLTSVACVLDGHIERGDRYAVRIRQRNAEFVPA